MEPTINEDGRLATMMALEEVAQQEAGVASPASHCSIAEAWGAKAGDLKAQLKRLKGEVAQPNSQHELSWRTAYCYQRSQSCD